jgi:hypothetical protein
MRVPSQNAGASIYSFNIYLFNGCCRVSKPAPGEFFSTDFFVYAVVLPHIR